MTEAVIVAERIPQEEVGSNAAYENSGEQMSRERREVDATYTERNRRTLHFEVESCASK